MEVVSLKDCIQSKHIRELLRIVPDETILVIEDSLSSDHHTVLLVVSVIY